MVLRPLDEEYPHDFALLCHRLRKPSPAIEIMIEELRQAAEDAASGEEQSQ